MTRYPHRWHGSGFTTLTLPSTDGQFEVLRSWHCWHCGATGSATGQIGSEPQTLSPAQWDAAVVAQRKNTDPAAQQMAKHWRKVEVGQKRLKHTRSNVHGLHDRV